MNKELFLFVLPNTKDSKYNICRMWKIIELLKYKKCVLPSFT